MPTDKVIETSKVENQLYMAEKELQGWERNGSQVHINSGRALVLSLRRQLDALRHKMEEE